MNADENKMLIGVYLRSSAIFSQVLRERLLVSVTLRGKLKLPHARTTRVELWCASQVRPS
jgi:hypothetical protein